MKFLKVTQPWKDELADLVQKVEAKLPELKKTQALKGRLLTEHFTKESLEQAKGSITEMTVVHDTLQDVYTRWFDKTNKIIEECKEQRRHAATSGSRMSHK